MYAIGLILFGVLMFTLVVLMLVGVILYAKSRLVASGNITIDINDDPNLSLEVATGGKLFNALSEHKIFLPAACGGGGTCGECKCIVKSG